MEPTIDPDPEHAPAAGVSARANDKYFRPRWCCACNLCKPKIEFTEREWMKAATVRTCRACAGRPLRHPESALWDATDALLRSVESMPTSTIVPFVPRLEALVESAKKVVQRTETAYRAMAAEPEPEPEPVAAVAASAPLTGPATSLDDLAQSASDQLPELPQPSLLNANERSRHRDQQWYVMLERLRQYRSIHGDTNVPTKYTLDPALAQWVVHQRNEYKKYTSGKKCNITEDRILELENLNFIWNAFSASWERRYKELVLYKTQNGHCRVPQKFKQNPALGKWVDHQRNEYRKKTENKPSLMTDERIKALDDIGFIWSTRAAKTEATVVGEKRNADVADI